MKKIVIGLGSVITLGLPMLVLAAGPNLGSTSYLGNLITQVGQLLSNLVMVLISLAVVWFTWNVIKYTMSEDDDGKEKARSQMVNGIIAIAVMVSIWGIVALLRNAFGTDGNNAPPPSINNMIPGVESAKVIPASAAPNNAKPGSVFMFR